MMGRLKREQEQLFYSFCLEEAVPDDHLVRAIAAVLDLSWVHGELAPYYSPLGRPSIDPVLMIRMLIVGYVFAIRSERAVPRGAGEPGLSLVLWALIEDRSRIIRHSRVRATNGSVTATSSGACSSVLLRPVLPPGWSAVKGLRSMRA